MINARAETVSAKPAFRDALRKRRCLIPVDGFYEWKKTPEGKNPFFIRMCDERHFFLAGLWERWISPEGDAIESCAVITTRANALISPIHDRMPVIVQKENINLWLDSTVQDIAALEPLLVPLPPEEMLATPVSRRVNDPKNKDADCLEVA